jgi:hypothetical protein
MSNLNMSVILGASCIFLSCTAAADGPRNTRTPAMLTGPALPIPKDLCSSQDEKRIRRRVATSRASGGGKGLMPGAAGALVPCKHGRLRYLRFSRSKQDILVIVEEDRRPSYISGGSHKRSLALVNRTRVHGADELWRIIRHKDKLGAAEIAKLLVAALMFGAQPNMILNSRQSKDLVSRWPVAAKALSIDPPGLRMKDGARPVLQAWTTHSYSERGISCRYLEGWRVSFDRAKGLKRVRNHAYASGRRMGRPCGKPLPGAAR